LFQPERDLMERLIAMPDTAPNALLGEVDGDARILLADLLDHPWGAINVDAQVDGALNLLQARPLERELARVRGEMTFTSDANRKDELTREMMALQKQIRVLDRVHWNVINKGRGSAI
jgi:hypothetical protein